MAVMTGLKGSNKMASAAPAPAFVVGDYVVYPKHGVGRVIELQQQEIAGMKLELYVLRFEKEKMTLRVPTNKVESVGMRKLSSDKTMQEALVTLKGKPKVKRTMWSRRAQEYEAKINSGDKAIQNGKFLKAQPAASRANSQRLNRPMKRARQRRFSTFCASMLRPISSRQPQPQHEADARRCWCDGSAFGGRGAPALPGKCG
jgi:RNA polymerase-interacting CarD/CdnL/TRCF family regulator